MNERKITKNRKKMLRGDVVSHSHTTTDFTKNTSTDVENSANLAPPATQAR